MKKLLIASAVAALFATPATVLAQAKPPSGPTLGSVLEASGINVSGHIDAGYTHADRNIEAPGFSTRVFDSQNNSFVLRQVGLTVAKQPKEGFGALVNITAGRDAEVINSVGATPSQFDLTQAYAQYAGGPLTVIAGKFVTLHGTEVIASPGNANISRSILFGAIPFTHTGVRVTWALNDQFSFVGGLNNGWDQLVDGNKGKTVELGAIMNPIKPLSITASLYSGKEVPPGGVGEGTRDSVNVVATYNITDTLSAGAEILYVTQDVPGGSKVKYNGIALYGGYLFMPKLRGSLRLEQFDDKNGVRFGTAPTGVEYREGTATVAYLAADNFELRGEVRRDSADRAVFVDSNGATSKTLMTVALQVLYKF